MIRYSRHKQLFRSCGISNGPANSIHYLACCYLCKRLQCSRAYFDVFWLNSARALICGIGFSKELVCSSFYWASRCCRRAAKATKTLPCCAMNARICSRMSSGIVENIYWVCCWYWYQNLGGEFFFHSCLLVPYFSWKYFHRCHHSNTMPTIGRAMWSRDTCSYCNL
jgi:hypothetical protein